MVYIQLDDGTSALEVSVFSELLDTERAKIREDEVLIVEGRVQRDDFAGEGRVKIVAERLLTLAEARGRFARLLRLSLNGQAGANPRATAQRLRDLLAPFTPGDCPVRVSYRNREATCELALGDANRVRLEDDLLSALREWLGQDNATIDYP
jgi:DNA polymerase-3 subunit alpha